MVRFSINPVQRDYLGAADQKDRERCGCHTNLVAINQTRRTAAGAWMPRAGAEFLR